MKKILNYVLPAAAFTLVASFAKANTEISLVNNEIVKVATDEAKNVSVSVSDDNGTTLYEFTGAQSGVKNLDFSVVPDGTYFIKVENSKTIETTLVNKTNNAIHISKNYGLIVKPVFQKKDKSRLNIYYVNPAKANVEVDVYDSNHNLVDSFTSGDFVIEKGLDFSKIHAGSYDVVLSAQNSNEVFSQTFENE